MITGLRLVMYFSMAFLMLGYSAAYASDAASKCQNLYLLSDLDHAVEPGVIIPASGEIPTHCQVRGVIDGSIRFEVSMPLEGWEGRLMFLAHGGNSGRIGNTKALMKDGFAGATTNSGHDEGPNSSSFVRDHNALINFGFRAVHLSTVVAKKVIGVFYGEAVDHAYIQGCSGGGRSALMEALRFPDDYDGVIAGAPALGWINSIVPWGIAVSRLQQKHPLTPESLTLLAANSRQKCDRLDGLEDGLISSPQACTLEVLALGDLACADATAQGCLTTGQIETARFIYTGMTDDAGRVVYNGIYPGDEDQGDWMMWVTGVPGQASSAPGSPLTAYEAMGTMLRDLSHDDPTFDLQAFHPIEDQAALARVAAPIELPAPDFTRFRKLGGKLIIYHGWQDVPLRSRDTIDFLHRAVDLSGGRKAMDAFSRIYMVPNMLHCAGGTGGWAADYIGPMVDWVERGRAPEGLVGTNPGITNWFEALAAMQGAESADWYGSVMRAGAAKDPATWSTRLLCPYPQVARYEGSGDIDDAESYQCRME